MSVFIILFIIFIAFFSPRLFSAVQMVSTCALTHCSASTYLYMVCWLVNPPRQNWCRIYTQNINYPFASTDAAPPNEFFQQYVWAPDAKILCFQPSTLAPGLNKGHQNVHQLLFP